MTGLGLSTARLDRAQWMRLADGLAVALVVALPWSTSITTILSVLWLIAVIPAIEPADLRNVVVTPAAGLPVVLFALLLIGMAWAIGVPMSERWDGIKSAYKLLFIPLLMAQFVRSQRADWMMVGFIASCVLLSAASWINIALPDRTGFLVSHRGGRGVPVHDYITQSGEFTACAFMLAAIALEWWRMRRHTIAVLVALLGASFLLDTFVIEASRTSLVVLPVLVLLFAARDFSRRGMIAILAAAAVAGASVLVLAPQVRSTVTNLYGEVRGYTPDADRTRAGERIEFWTKSIGSIANAPIFGHGTGSIRDQFRRVATGPENSMENLVAANPHNQTLAIAIQLGLLGVVTLWAMWIAHLLLFWRRMGFAAWAGLLIVTQNIVGSLFNSHLFDFVQGWGYVLGVGVAAGVMLKDNRTFSSPPRSAPAP